MCDFCKNFDFSRIKLVADKNGARIVIDQTGKANFSPKEVARFCPKCGTPIINGMEPIDEFEHTFLLTIEEE